MDQVPDYNARLRAIIDRIKADPSCHRQDVWHCDTAHCIGGWAQIDAGKAPDDNTASDDGMEWLGLNEAHAGWLFTAIRTLAEIEAFATWSDEQRCMAAVQQDGFAIHYLTDDQRTAEVCLAAVQQDGYAIRHLTDDQRTAEVCLAAVQQDGYAIHYLTDDQKQRAGL